MSFTRVCWTTGTAVSCVCLGTAWTTSATVTEATAWWAMGKPVQVTSTKSSKPPGHNISEIVILLYHKCSTLIFIYNILV